MKIMKKYWAFTWKILYFSVSLLLAFLFIQCEKEDLFDKYSPEILYKRYVQTQDGMQWQLSPDAVEVTLDPGVTEFTVYARISSPNGLKKITVYEVNNGTEKEVTSYGENDDAFTLSPNEYQLSQTFTNITSTKVVRITAIDRKNHKTTRDFTIRK
ncbi:MAG: hypothetical protein LBU57_03980 [Dysgonamonadaceae bacterium]|nr:hypothetical protein [Dysgonamonadaceae bacterium]